MKTALVHDWIVGITGAEKVLKAICELYDGPIHTLIKEEKALTGTLLAERTIQSSFLQYLPRVQKYYRNLLPFFPFAIEQFDLSSYELIISSSHSAAKGVKTHKDQIHICYCHTPMRYAWDLYHFHLSQLDPLRRAIARPFLKKLRQWDQKTHIRVDHFIANSACVAKRIETNYGRPATIIYPPVDTHLFEISSEKEEFYFTCSRLVPYKRIDLLIEAFAQMPKKELIIIGDGPERKKYEAKAPQNVKLLGYQQDLIMRKMLAKARAFLFAPEEEFGIAAVEAQAAGIPVIAYGKGGNLETVLPGQTGIFFKEQAAQSIIDAVHRFEKMEGDFSPEKIQQHAKRFSKERFQEEFKAFCDQV